jgi:hypothetical protein
VRCPEAEVSRLHDFVSSSGIGYEVIVATKTYKQIGIEITRPVLESGETRVPDSATAPLTVLRATIGKSWRVGSGVGRRAFPN